MNGKIQDKNVDFLFQAILALETPEECYRFFDDLCTVPELKPCLSGWLWPICSAISGFIAIL